MRLCWGGDAEDLAVSPQLSQGLHWLLAQSKTHTIDEIMVTNWSSIWCAALVTQTLKMCQALSANPHISAKINRYNNETVNTDQCSLLGRINRYAQSAELTWPTAKPWTSNTVNIKQYFQWTILLFFFKYIWYQIVSRVNRLFFSSCFYLPCVLFTFLFSLWAHKVFTLHVFSHDHSYLCIRVIN